MDNGINQGRIASSFLYVLPSSDIVPRTASKKGNRNGSMGSKSKTNSMKSYRINKKEAGQKLKNKKRENALDIISKSLKSCSKSSGSTTINPVCRRGRPLNFSMMSTLKNKVQLIGNVGNDPKVTVLENGKKVIRFSLATNENYKNAKGEKVQSTNWHNIVAWNKTAEIIEGYTVKGKQIAIEGKLTSRSYETKEGEKRYVTEVVINEVLLLGTKNENKAA